MRLRFDRLSLGNRAMPALVCGALLGSGGAAWAASFTYTALNTNGSVVTTPQAINSSDQVVGTTSNANGDRVGFVWSAGQLTLVNGSEILFAINDSGIAVGVPWLNEINFYVSYDVSSGVLTDVPVNIGLKSKWFYAGIGINATGDVLGIAQARGGTAIGFLTIGGQSSKILPPNQKDCLPVGLNNKGDAIIDYRGDAASYGSFLYKKGKYASIAVPGASTTTAGFITDNDLIGGVVTSGSSTSGFLLSKGTYTTYSPVGATSSTVSGVGPSGQVYGTFVDAAGNTHGFVNVSGTYYQIDAPNSSYTSIFGVGTSGSIYGWYGNSSGLYGYIATCPKKNVCTQ
jgi:hypothetical protein